MRARVAAAVTALALAGALAACVSLKRSPTARFFVLRSLAEPPAAPTPSPVDGGVIGVGPVRLPGHLERPQIVTWRNSTEVEVDEFLRWAEPLDAGIARTLRENLANLFPGRRVVQRPWAGDLDLCCRVVVELSVFGMQGDGTVRLQGRWTLLPGREESPFRVHPVDLRRGPWPAQAGGPSPSVGIEAMSELLADLSRDIAEEIRARPLDEPESPPSP